MDLELALEKILDGQAILFAGAGFSYGAKNAQGNVPSAKQLKKDLLTDLGRDDNSEYPLEIVADFYKKNKSSLELIDLLKKQFNIMQVAEHHKEIMNVHWKRAYTTNYDQVIEKASKENDYEFWKDAVVLTDDFENTNKMTACIHINGYIERVNEEKLENEFKLTDSSYSCDALENNPWFQFMINDFEAASVIIVIGYSMQFDIDIKRLFSAPEISKKIIFIDSPCIDDISIGLLENYGSCYPIGIEEFSNKLASAKKSFTPSLNYEFNCFKYMYRDTLTSEKPTYEEIVKFYTEGKDCDKLYGKDSSGTYMYMIERGAMQHFLRNYRYKKVFIVLSNLGNGKSVFLKLAENELRREDVKVYTYIHRYNSLDDEIEKICSEKKRSVVIIDNYPGHLEIINKFAQYGHKNITFLLSSRPGVNLSFYKKLIRVLQIEEENISLLQLNCLQGQEINDMATVMKEQSLLTDVVGDTDEDLGHFIKDECKASFSNLLLRLFESSDIKNKLECLYKELEEDTTTKVKDVAIFALLKNVSNYDLSFVEILDLFQADYIKLMQNDIEFISEIFVYDGDGEGFNVRSSIISQWLVTNLIEMDDIIDVMEKAFMAADEKDGRTFLELQKAMVSHSQFLLFTDPKNKQESLALIEKFYNDIRNTKFAKHNTFFWEQFASAYLDMKKFDLAKKCIDTAFVEAKKNPYFVPFQVETVLGRYHVEKCIYDFTNGSCNTDLAIFAIQEATRAVTNNYFHPENNVYYAFRVANEFSVIYNYIRDSLDDRKRSIYIENATIMMKYMTEYLKNTEENNYYMSVEKWNKNISDTIADAKIQMNRGK